MRITFILPPVNMSGGIKVVSIYAKLLTDMGHQVTLVSTMKKPIPLRQKIKLLVKGQGWPALSFQASHVDGLGLEHRVINHYRPISDIDVPDADVVIATWWETAEWVNALSKSKGAKVYFVQGHEVFDYLPVARCKATYRMPLHKITIARWLANVMRDDYGDANVDIVPNGIDHRQFHAQTRGKQSHPTVGFLFHETPMKGMDVALAALNKLRLRFPELHVLCFGSKGPSTGLVIDDRIDIHENPPQDRIREIYAQCDVWLTASRSEGFNLPAMEAMACRTPVVSTRTGWPEESIRDGQNGFLVDIDDVDGLVHATEKILSLPDQAWREMSVQAYETVADSSWENSAQLFAKALEHAVERTRRGEIASDGVLLSQVDALMANQIEQPVFLVGSERSGSTLLRLMLDHHPEIAFNLESEFLVEQISDEGVFPVMERYHDWLNQDRVFKHSNFDVDTHLDFVDLLNNFLRQKLVRDNKKFIGATVIHHFSSL